MTSWQRRARLIIAVGAVVFAIGVGSTLKRRVPQSAVPPPVHSDPGTVVVETTGGRIERFKFSREDVRVAYERQLTYADGSTRLMGVTISADGRAGSRSFTVTGNEAHVGQNESAIQLNGDVRVAASDGMAVRTGQATYSDNDGLVRAAGPVEFSRGRMSGSGVGMTFDTARDVLVLLDRAVVHVAPDEQGAGATEIASGTATFARREKNLRFERDVTLQRGGQLLEADAAVAYLTLDETQIQLMELRGRSRITKDQPAAGGLQELTGRDMDLEYAADGEALEHALLTGDAAIVLAGSPAGAGRVAAGRRIAANTIDVALADGATPTALTARDAVVLTLPAEGRLPERTIRSDAMEATSTPGQPARGLTHARFTGDVTFRERGAGLDRMAGAATLEVALEAGMAGFRDATFLDGAHFIEGETAGEPLDNPCASSRPSRIRMCAARIRYDLDKGFVELTGSEPGTLRPRVVNDQMAVEAARIDVALAGPDLKAAGAVKSVLSGRTDTQLPSMFKQDRPVNVTADTLDYLAAPGTATYAGNAQLWQEETSIKGASIVLDEKTGDLSAGGGVTTVTVRDAAAGSKETARVRSIATASDFRYEEAARRAIYTGKAHVNSPDGDMTAARIELSLKPSGAGENDLERVEAYERVTLRDRNRTITGERLTYTTADQRYVVTGAPVRLLDECRRETVGSTLTYLKSSETVTIDGNEQTRTQTKGSGQCP
jgi:lipopolysaccharide export system protein LptA